MVARRFATGLPLPPCQSRHATLDSAKAPLWEPSADSGEDENKNSDDELIAELASLSRLAYAKRRRDAAKQLDITAGELDRIIAQARGDSREKEPAPALYPHWNVEPSDEVVAGDILLRSLTERLRRYVIMSEDQALVVALWIVLTHGYTNR
jgi:hypothetical protein